VGAPSFVEVDSGGVRFGRDDVMPISYVPGKQKYRGSRVLELRFVEEPSNFSRVQQQMYMPLFIWQSGRFEEKLFVYQA
jgi:hypothetical protein